ncbi:S8 family serine peptidase [Isoptericola haloaureus]|uniref:S8 family serine peptidase n=1 Tax=Isoptericola haloaureus TaxID=1542902 RepID=A0ABU7Z7I1_9MICO
MNKFRRYLAGACAGVLLAPLVALSAQADDADPSTTAAPPEPGTESAVVTLLTGDRVHVTSYPDDAIAIDVEAAERPDGAVPVFSKREVDGHVYVVPSDVAQHVPSLLDPALFDVKQLVEDGFDDAASEDIPVIVDYGDTVPTARSRSTLPGIEVERTLASIGAVSADIDKDDAGAFLAALDRQAAAAERSRARTGGIEKIWLDHRVEALLDVSTPQIGAPELWDAGYTGEGMTVAVLDSGIDASHPDLVGKVVAEANFSNAVSATDRHGHGTHVATTIAGTGAASDGTYRGVAYEADVINGKILNDYGVGNLSEIIAGMEWAAESGADVVNMSVGTRRLYTDGTDPGSQAVDELSEEFDTLFVVAAGNDGAGSGTVTSPGAASAALTVGAVNDADVVARFSSRGPRAGDNALKPEVTAPGVGIVAGRAAGTNRGSVVGEHYTSVSGTSMATPHVAGAAALLLQQRPDLSAPELKGLLATTALLGDESVFEQGTGRIDLPRAMSTPVLADTGSLSMGFFDYPQDDTAPVTRTVTYRNVGEAEVTLDVDLEIADADGTAPATGMVVADEGTLTVPVAGSVEVSVTVDPTLGEPGLYSGYLTATDAAGQVLRSGVAFTKEAERYDLVVESTDRKGLPAGGLSSIDVINVDDRATYDEPNVRYEADGTATFRVPAGHYSVGGLTYTYDESGRYALEATAVLAPEVLVTEDTAVELDARDAVSVDVDTPRETEVYGTQVAYQRVDAKGTPYSHTWSMSAPIGALSVTPTPDVEVGAFEFYNSQTLRAPEIEVTAGGTLDLTARYARFSERLDGDIDTELVDAGLGAVEDYASLDVDGKIALVERTGNSFGAQIAAAEDAGAQAVLFHNHEPGLVMINGVPGAIPHLTMTQAEGDAVRTLMDGGSVDLSVTAIAASPYLYETMFPEQGGVPAELDYAVTAENSATVTASYRAQVEGVGIADTRHRWRPWEASAFGLLRILEAPMVRTEMVTADDTMWGHNYYINSSPTNPYGAYMADTRHLYEAGAKVEENFLTQVMAPGFSLYGQDTATRSGDRMMLNVQEWTDSDAHWGGFYYRSDSSSFRLFEDGEPVAQGMRAQGAFAVGSEPAEYRIELDVARDADWWTMSTATSTAWTVQSTPEDGETEVLPLLRARLHPDVDLLNRANASAHHVDVTVDHQPGAEAAPIAETRFWVSTDDGGTWREVPVRRHGKDGLRAVVNQLSDDAEFVSVRVEVTDTAGNVLEQEITRAYGLR